MTLQDKLTKELEVTKAEAQVNFFTKSSFTYNTYVYITLQNFFHGAMDY